MRRVFALVGVLALASTLGACGDDDDEEVRPAVTPDQYAQQVDKVCSQLTNEISTTFGEAFPVVSFQVHPFVTQVTPTIDRRMEDLLAVPTPSEEKEEVTRVRRAAQLLRDRWKKAAEEPSESRKLIRQEGGFQGFRKASKAFGRMPACEHLGEETGGAEGPKKLDPKTFSDEKKMYVKAVDKICKSADAKDNKIEKDIFGKGYPPSTRDWARGLPEFAALGQERLVAFQQVPPPKQDKATIDRLIGLQQTIVNRLQEAGQVAVTGNEKALAPVLQQVFDDFDQLDAEFRKYGFQVCGSEDEPG